MTPAAARLGGERILITGGDGMLARGFREALDGVEGVAVRAVAHDQLDVTDRHAVLALVAWSPTLILHCGGQALADRCERDPEMARASHVEGTRHVAQLANACGARVFYPQSVFIFDGRELPVTEETRPHPPFTYGRVKLEAEQLLLAEVPGTLAVRMAGFFGGDEKDKNFVGQFTRQLRRMLAEGIRTCEVGDRVWQPTYTLDLARNVLLLLARRCTGVYHMGSQGEATFHDVAAACVEALDLGGHVAVTRCPAEQVAAGEPAARPLRMVTATRRLDQEGLNLQRPWREALAEYLARPWFADLRRAGSLR